MIGSAVGPYQILDRLGAGGMGEVFLGHDPRLQRRVALKCLAAPPSGSVGDRILREARAVARLNHPHIAAVYDVLEQDDRTFIVMEYVEGESLAARLRRGKPSVEEIRSVGRQLASALAAAHAQGVVHRDLKPANVMFARDGSIKVLDFGVAKLSSPVAGTEEATGHVAPESTLEGNPGTPVYMSPEQLFDRPIDGRSDIYSAGAILYEMAAGQRPYLETGAVALAMAMANAPPPFPRSIVPSVPADLDAVIMRALERDPDRRFQSAKEMEEACDPSSGTVGKRLLKSGPIPQSTLRNRLWMSAVAALLLAALVAIAARTDFLARARLWRSGSPSGHVVLAILPVDNPVGDLQAAYLGAGIAAVVADNFGSVPGVTALARASTAAFEHRRQDVAALHRELGADYVIDLAIQSVLPQVRVDARLRATRGNGSEWHRSISGDVLSVERSLLDGLATALQDVRALSRPLPEAEVNRIHRVPTNSGPALLAYSEALARLDARDVAGNIDRAIELLQQAIAADSSFALAQATLGDALWARYQKDRRTETAEAATEAIRRALSADSGQPHVYYSLANMQNETGQYELAIESVRRAIELQPDNDDAHRLLSMLLVRRGETDAAVREAREAARVRPFWNNYYTLGYVTMRAGRYDEALDAYRKTVAVRPDFGGGYQMLGTVYHILGDVPQAIGNYEHAVRLNQTAQGYSNLALAYYAGGRYEEAVKAYSEAIKRDPNQAPLHRDIGDALQRLGRPKDARAEYDVAIGLAERGLSVNSRNVDAISLIALTETKLGRRAAAESHISEALALAPKNPDVLFRAAQVAALLGNRDAAISYLRAAIAIGIRPRVAGEADELASLKDTNEYRAVVAQTREQ